jgi:hypothetical protein
MGKIKTYSLIILIIIVFFTSGYIGIKYMGRDKGISQKDFEKLISNPAELEKTGVKIKDEKDFMVEIHRRANTLIIAEDNEVWGKEEITEEGCNALILQAMASNYINKQRYIEILERWKQGDFSQGVQDHNFVWELLGGTVGRAKGLKDKYVNKTGSSDF